MPPPCFVSSPTVGRPRSAPRRSLRCATPPPPRPSPLGGPTGPQGWLAAARQWIEREWADMKAAATARYRAVEAVERGDAAGRNSAEREAELAAPLSSPMQLLHRFSPEPETLYSEYKSPYPVASAAPPDVEVLLRERYMPLDGRTLRSFLVDKYGLPFDVHPVCQRIGGMDAAYFHVMWKHQLHMSFPLSEPQYLAHLEALTQILRLHPGADMHFLRELYYSRRRPMVGKAISVRLPMVDPLVLRELVQRYR